MAAATKLSLPDWAEPLLYPARYKSIRGGRGSSKSHSAVQSILARMGGFAPGYEPGPVRIVSARDFEVTLSESIKSVMEGYIKKWGLEDEFIVMKTEIRHINGSVCYFKGVNRSPESYMSMEGIDVFFMEQAENLMEEMNVIEPSIRKKGSELWFIWNPLHRDSWCWKRFVDNPMPDDVNLLVNWNHNPWWGETELESLRLKCLADTPDLYDWIWMGQPYDADATASVLPYVLLERCVEAYGKYYTHDDEAFRQTYAGLDIAEGGADKCALVIRQGPNVEVVEVWPGVVGDMSVAAKKAAKLCENYEILRIFYDASSPAKTDLRKVGFLGVIPVHFGGAVSGPDTLYEPKITNGMQFSRRNIQMGDALRLRANLTAKLLAGKKNINPKDCLFINPNIRNLTATLADFGQPKRRVSPSTGKWELVKAAGNEKSPDRFDALCLAFGRDTHKRGLKART